VWGSYLVGVKALGLDPGTFFHNIKNFSNPDDIAHGLIKSVFYGFICSLIACYEGYNTSGGAAGVGQATNRAVVFGIICIFVLDYFLTVLLSGFNL